MARARNIKPSFFTNEQLADNDPLGRLLFIGLWTIADYNGNLEFKARTIKVQVLPWDDCNIKKLMIDLDKSGLIRFYSDSKKLFINIPNFTKHQSPHKNEREKPSDIPEYNINHLQVIDYTTLTINHDLSGSIPNNSASDRAESLLLNPHSLIPDNTIDTNVSIVVNGETIPDCPHQEIISLYKKNIPMGIQPKAWDGARAVALKSRWRERKERQDLAWWDKFFDYVSQSKFLTGQVVAKDRKPFEITLPWLLKPENFNKIIEGFYHR